MFHLALVISLCQSSFPTHVALKFLSWENFWCSCDTPVWTPTWEKNMQFLSWFQVFFFYSQQIKFFFEVWSFDQRVIREKVDLRSSDNKLDIVDFQLLVYIKSLLGLTKSVLVYPWLPFWYFRWCPFVLPDMTRDVRMSSGSVVKSKIQAVPKYHYLPTQTELSILWMKHLCYIIDNEHIVVIVCQYRCKRDPESCVDISVEASYIRVFFISSRTP